MGLEFWQIVLGMAGLVAVILLHTVWVEDRDEREARLDAEHQNRVERYRK